jgi:hypothetical protein
LRLNRTHQFLIAGELSWSDPTLFLHENVVPNSAVVTTFLFVVGYFKNISMTALRPSFARAKSIRERQKKSTTTIAIANPAPPNRT